MNDLPSLLLFALVCIAIGFALGSLVSSVRSDREEVTGRSTEQGKLAGNSDFHQISDTPPIEHSTSPQPDSAPIRSFQGPTPDQTSLHTGLNPVRTLAKAPKPAKPDAQSLPKSIANQIDEILQEMLAAQPQPAEKRAVRLLELPGKGMVVMVGLDQYDGVEAVPDSATRQLIQAAVAEWEKRMFAG